MTTVSVNLSRLFSINSFFLLRSHCSFVYCSLLKPKAALSFSILYIFFVSIISVAVSHSFIDLALFDLSNRAFRELPICAICNKWCPDKHPFIYISILQISQKFICKGQNYWSQEYDYHQNSGYKLLSNVTNSLDHFKPVHWKCLF